MMTVYTVSVCVLVHVCFYTTFYSLLLPHFCYGTCFVMLLSMKSFFYFQFIYVYVINDQQEIYFENKEPEYSVVLLNTALS